MVRGKGWGGRFEGAERQRDRETEAEAEAETERACARERAKYLGCRPIS